MVGFPSGSDSKESACSVEDRGSIPGVGKIPWRREWQPSPIFLPGKFHGQRSLVSFSPWSCKEWDMTEQLTQTHIIGYSNIKEKSYSIRNNRRTKMFAAAKSLQSCPTLCDPIDSSPPGSPVPGIPQERTLEWVAITFANACMHAK